MGWPLRDRGAKADIPVTQILLTGASGFVGRHVLRALLGRGHKVRAITRTRLNISESNLEQLMVDDLFAASDDWLADACAGIDMTIHCAWYAEPGQYLNSPRNLTCLRGTLALAEAARRSKVSRFVGIGTCFEYEISSQPLPVSTPLNPQSPYAASKAAAYLALSGNFPASGISFAWCRLFYLFGEGEDERRFVPYVRKQLSRGQAVELTAGTQVRDFLDVAEAARQIVEIAASDHSGAANICSGRPQTIRAMAERIADEYGRRSLLRFGARAENAIDPPFVVGVPSIKAYRK